MRTEGSEREGEAGRSNTVGLGGEGDRVMPSSGLGFRNKGRSQHLMHGLGSDHGYTRFEYNQIHFRNSCLGDTLTDPSSEEIMPAFVCLIGLLFFPPVPGVNGL